MDGAEKAYEDIVRICREHGAHRVVLFGSRARGTNLPKSDIDVAVTGARDFGELYDALQNDVWSLLEIDVVDLDAAISNDLREEISRDRVVLYEEV